MEKFIELGVCREINDAILEQNFKKPTPIQIEAIPKALAGENIICGAPTGSGKTLVYLSKIITDAKLAKGVQALIITPTRELAGQVEDMTTKFSKYKNLNVACLYGGKSFNKEIEDLKLAEIVIGTPGRILDHMNKGNLDFSKLRTLVLDEADFLLSEEHREDLEKVINATPKTRQVLFFSATITDSIAKLAQKYVKKASRVFVGKQVDASKLKQYYYLVEQNQKLSVLNHLIKYEKSGKSLVFVNREELTKFIVKHIKPKDIKIKALYAQLSQAKREKILEDFYDEKIDVLVCTDLFARGLDFDDITHIYNYNIPKKLELYIHRIGRCARAGGEGKVFNFITKKDVEIFTKIMNENNFLPISKDLPNFENIEIKEEESTKDFNKKLKTYRKKN